MVPAHGTAYERICRGPVTAKPHFWNFRKLQFPATGLQGVSTESGIFWTGYQRMVTSRVTTETAVLELVHIRLVRSKSHG